jgi:hypothetical protein
MTQANPYNQNRTSAMNNHIHETYQLDKFSFLEGNRNIDEFKVAKLAAEIKQHGLIMPIMVNSKLEVIDGQHRLSACRKIGMPVQYFVRDNATVETAANVNIAGSNWRQIDWIKKHAFNGNEDYVDLLDWIHLCKSHNLNEGSAIFLAQNTATTTKYAMYEDGVARVRTQKKSPNAKQLYSMGSDIRLGMWTFGDRLVAQELLQSVLMFQGFKFYNKKSFVVAIIRVSRISQFDINNLHKQALKRSKYFTHQSSSDDFLRMFEDVYNYGRPQKNRLAIVNNPELKKS